MMSGRSLVFAALVGLCQGTGNFKGHKLFQANPETERHSEILRQMDDNLPEDLIDFWSHSSDPSVEFLVNASMVDPITEVLNKENLTYTILYDDFQTVVDDEKKQIQDSEGEFEFRNPGEFPDPRKQFNLFNYHRLDDINYYINQMSFSYADMITVKSIGTTYEGRSINMVALSLNPTAQKATKTAIFLECGIHAREWISPATCLYAIDELVGKGSNGLLKQYDFYIIPVANPDGYAYTWDGNRMWRKNRRPSSRLLLRASPRQFWPGQGLPGYPGLISQFPEKGFNPGSNSGSKCWGTDPNRNFDIAHASVGSSNNMCQDTYHGDAPFSEAESQAIRNAIVDIMAKHNGAKNVIYVSIHAFSQLWMYPNGYSKSRSQHHFDLKRVAEKATSALSAVYGTRYTAGPIANVIYEAAGSSTDWAHAKMGIKYAFALELRDTGVSGFMLPVNQIQPTVEETWAGINGMALEIARKY